MRGMRNVVVALAAAVAGNRRFHQFRTEPVLQVALQDTLFDQNGFVRRIAFVVDVQRPATKRNRSVVDNGAEFGSDFLTDQTGECRCLLSIEIGFEAVADRFVQQNAGPARSEDNFHRAGRRIDGAELQNRLARAFACQRRGIQIAGKNIERTAAAAALITGLTLAVFFGDAHDIQAHQRLKIPDAPAVGGHDQDVLGFIDVTRLNLFDPGIVGSRSLIRLLEQRDLLRDLEFRREDGDCI